MSLLKKANDGEGFDAGRRSSLALLLVTLSLTMPLEWSLTFS
jgi:hypothetical protein